MTDLVGDERGVSPVIGVALLIAITVVLAAVIGFVVLDAGTGPGVDQPSARLALNGDADTDTLTLDHEGGDPVNASNVDVRLSSGTNDTLEDATSTSIGTLETGDDVEIDSGDFSNTTYTSGQTVTLIYDPPNEEGKTQLAEFTFP